MFVPEHGDRCIVLESLAFAILKAYVAYAFDAHLRQQETILIEGAPRWYYHSIRDNVCASGFARGGLEAVEFAKLGAHRSLTQVIDITTKVMVDEQFHSVRTPIEWSMITDFENDADLFLFLSHSGKYLNVEYRQDIQTAFTRFCVTLESLMRYQAKRLEEIHLALLLNQRDEAFNELERSIVLPQYRQTTPLSTYDAQKNPETLFQELEDSASTDTKIPP